MSFEDLCNQVSDCIDSMRYAMGQNPMEDDDMITSGLDPYQIEYARKLAAERAQQEHDKQLAMQNVFIHNGSIDPAAFTVRPGSLVTGTTTYGGMNWTTAVKPMAVLHEPTQAEKDTDKRRHLKLFIHFAKQFAERYTQWEVVPDKDDPLHSVHLVRRDIGAIIHNLYPSNEMAVYGGPSSWTDPRKELGQQLPIVKINTQEFWGWCVGMDDVPEWMTK